MSWAAAALLCGALSWGGKRARLWRPMLLWLSSLQHVLFVTALHARRHHAKGCGTSLRRAFLGWQASTSLASVAALVEPASARPAHDCLHAYRSPKNVTILNNLSHTLSQLAADVMSGNDNGYPSGIMEMSVWQADQHDASNHEQGPLPSAEFGLKAPARTEHASNDDIVQDSAKIDLINCPPRQD